MFWKKHFMYKNRSQEQYDIASTVDAEKNQRKVVFKISAEA